MKIWKEFFLIVKILHPNLLCIDIAKESLAYFNLWTFLFYFYKLREIKEKNIHKDNGGRKTKQRRGKAISILCSYLSFQTIG